MSKVTHPIAHNTTSRDLISPSDCIHLASWIETQPAHLTACSIASHDLASLPRTHATLRECAPPSLSAHMQHCDPQPDHLTQSHAVSQVATHVASPVATQLTHPTACSATSHDLTTLPDCTQTRGSQLNQPSSSHAASRVVPQPVHLSTCSLVGCNPARSPSHML